MKMRPVGTELFHADRKTDGRTDGHDEANSRFSQFLERAQKKKFIRKHDKADGTRRLAETKFI